MFHCIRLKSVIVFMFILIISVGVSAGIVVVVKGDSVPKPTYTIVVDAGHGGRDDGCTGSAGTRESEINLKIARNLKLYLETLGIKVVMTRNDGNGLYDSNAENFKLSDMEKRLNIIDDTHPDMVISIHQNSFADSLQRGAQVFYQEDDMVSKGFADSMQRQLLLQLVEARQESNAGDYYLLKECGLPAVIVECGYLTNVEDEALLCSEGYQKSVAYAIMCGVVDYLNLCGND